MAIKKLLSAFIAVLILLSLFSCENQSEVSGISEAEMTSAEASEKETTSEDTSETETTSEDTSEAEKFAPPEFDPKLLDGKAKEYLGELLPIYEKCVDAIVNYEPTVSGFKSFDDFEKVFRVIDIAFYPTPALIETFADTSEPYEFDGESVTFHFKNRDRASHDAAYNAFKNEVDAGLSRLKEGDDEWETAAKLFSYAHGSMAYGYGSRNLYECVTNHLGICGDYAEYLALLMRNAGFETYICGEEIGIEGLGHEWTMAKIEGVWYHFDACWGFGAVFGMSTKTRLDTLWEALVPDMPREDFDKAIKLFGDSWFDESEEFPDCPQDISDSDREKTDPILYGNFE